MTLHFHKPLEELGLIFLENLLKNAGKRYSVAKKK